MMKDDSTGKEGGRESSWNALAISRAGLVAHVVEVADDEVRRVACSNRGEGWEVVETAISGVRLCGSCRRALGGANGAPAILMDAPPALPVVGVEWTSPVATKVVTTDEYRGGSA